MRTKKRLLWRLYPPYVLLVLSTIAVTTWYAVDAAWDFHRGQTEADLEARARLLAPDIAAMIEKGDMAAVAALCTTRGRTGARLTVIRPDGVVVGDSEEDPAHMQHHGNRPEIQSALRGDVNPSVRTSHTLGKDMLYVAAPVHADAGAMIGVVRLATPLTSFGEALGDISLKLILVGVLVAVGAALVCLLISRSIARPLECLKAGAQRYAQGDLSHRLHLSDTEEVSDVAEAMNAMAAQLAHRLETTSAQRGELHAILGSMAEGVLAVDPEERIIGVNKAGATLLGAAPEELVGRLVYDVIRNPTLEHVIARSLAGDENVQEEVVLFNGTERYLQAHGSLMCGDHGTRTGAVVVLEDVTHLKRLETIRSAFVANVSDELKTPLTSIKGCVETLQGGAKPAPEDVDRLLDIIARQVDRLQAMVEDLLLLSKLERFDSQGASTMEEMPVARVLQRAMDARRADAAKKNVQISTRCDPDVTAEMHADLVVQAVVNLIDNAIQCSDEGQTVVVDAERSGDGVTIRVRDEGCGIEHRHLPRLFERFYRVDKARSRQLGGTGLGLSMVKHIAQVHGGRALVESRPGEGSVFSLELPSRRRPG